MKIGVIGTHCTGKSTYVNDFLKNWKMYDSPKSSYRDLIKEKNLPHSKDGNEESQKLILDHLVEQAIQTSKMDFAITDRCILDNLAYSSWLNLNGKVSDKFLDESRILVRETLKLYDIIFFIPLTKVAEVKIEENDFRETDPVYREEIDNIFKVFHQSYLRGDGRIFPANDSPAMIEIYGDRETRIKMTELYLTKDGKPYGDDDSLISDIVPATTIPKFT
jgi:hypothetical protein